MIRPLVAAVTNASLLWTGGGAFHDVAAQSGLLFQHVNGASGRYHLPEIMGAGCALLDYDSDGDLDVLLLQGRALEPFGATPVAPSRPQLFRNDLSSGNTRRVRFSDVTARAGFAAGDYAMGVAVGDYDNDGDPDLYVTNFGQNRLYRNNGDGTFRDVTRAAGDGLDDPRWSSSASFSDYDADGDLDLFVANYVNFTVAGAKVCHDPTGVRDYCGPLQFRPVPDRLFRNNGDGTFVDVSESSGITRADGAGLGVSAADFDGDGRTDFFVANDASANQLWLNRGNGTFEDGALAAGTAFNMDGQPEGSMGIAAGDADNDGDLDLFVTNITRETHAFYRNLGAGQFEDARLRAGIAAATVADTGFGTEFFDYDHDGLLDLFTANGAVTMIEALRGDPFPFRQKNRLLRNTASGRFLDVSATGGPAFQVAEVSRGAAFGDVDNDGDVDVLVTANGGAARLLLNDAGGGRDWLQVRLQGVADTWEGAGARVGVRRHDGSVLWRRAHTDGSYLSASDPRVHFGLGANAQIREVIVEWLRGPRESWSNVRPNQIVSLKQGTGKKHSEG